ncbi:hypothetical protein ACH0BP_01740 [Bacillus nitratireducens]|uniref:hypothetical protein n=1 Tax=Bacillus nitratireducens TaxID=2026193 RepID=UPI0008FDAB0D|nr:hypothetical protein [Bacillus nitratireducens]OJD37248.1 hypothetical protein BAU23_26355 [Bacillus nitratireducens]
MKMQKNWWLGFLGLIGIYKIPGMIEAFQADKGWLALISLVWLALISLVWLLWFGYFIPETKTDK